MSTIINPCWNTPFLTTEKPIRSGESPAEPPRWSVKSCAPAWPCVWTGRCEGQSFRYLWITTSIFLHISTYIHNTYNTYYTYNIYNIYILKKHVFQRILFIAGSPGSPWAPWCVGPARGSRGAGDLHGDRGASHGHVQGGAPWIHGDCYGWPICLAITENHHV